MQAGRAEVRERARACRPPPCARAATGTVFFLDEIHRFNKAQQDALLPAVEEGLVTLIGATTENPAFEVNGALLSRMRVYALQALTAEEVAEVLSRALAARELGGAIAVEEGGARVPRGAQRRRRAHGAERARAGGDDGGELGETRVGLARAEDALQRRAVLYDARGTATTTTSRRGSRPRAARTPTPRCTTWR